MNSEQITRDHTRRQAYIYIRQSTQHQVIHNRESQRRQRQLVERACDLGWPRDQIVLIDEDLGQSGAHTQKRPGFQKLVAAAALSEVGIILALEVSRLSRGSQDWYHLLDICSVTRTLLADGEGLYDPTRYNDRLLLGLKGTMSEAELNTIKERLVEAMLAKARRGEFRFRPAPGYVWDEAGRLQQDPDAQVRSVIALIFERFTQLGTIGQVQQALAAEGIQIPVKSGIGDKVRWSDPNYSYLQRVLKNPIYAGAYVFGRTEVAIVLDGEQRPQKRTRQRSQERWPVLITDHHTGYIDWQKYERNQEQISSNRRGRTEMGAAREGKSLLQGLVLCGRCGRQMKVEYSGRARNLRYTCLGRQRQAGVGTCQSFGALRIEQAVAQLVLEAISPVGVEAMIAATEATVAASKAEHEHWQQRIQRAGYEVDLAQRQYESVDPANRLVASELERRWEQALQNLEAVEVEAGQRIDALAQPLSPADQQRLRGYAADLPTLWHAASTRIQDKKRIVRCLIENVVVTKPDEGSMLTAAVHWIGGEVTDVEVARGRVGIHCHVAEPELLVLIRDLAQEFGDDQIARILMRRKMRTPKGLPFTARRVTGLRYSNGIPGRCTAQLKGDDTYTADQAGPLLGVDRSTVIRWVEAGLLQGSQHSHGAPWRIRVTAADIERLTAQQAPAGWVPLKGAAEALGVSQQTVLQRLKSGQLEGVRVRTGGRTAWRIRVPETSYEGQRELFNDEPHACSRGDAL